MVHMSHKKNIYIKYAYIWPKNKKVFLKSAQEPSPPPIHLYIIKDPVSWNVFNIQLYTFYFAVFPISLVHTSPHNF